MDSQPQANPPDLLAPPTKSPRFSCFMDCCKPKKQSQEDEDGVRSMDVVSEAVKPKEIEDSMEEPTTSEAVVVPAANGFSPQAFMEFLKMLLSFLIIESLGEKGKPKTVDDKQEHEDIPILEG